MKKPRAQTLLSHYLAVFLTTLFLGGCGNGSSNSGSNSGSGGNNSSTAEPDAGTNPDGSTAISTEQAYCNGSLPAAAAVPTNDQTGQVDQTQSVSAVDLKLLPSGAGSSPSTDTNDPLRVQTVLSRVLAALAVSVPNGPFATPGAQAAVHLDHQMSGGAAVIVFGQDVSEKDAKVLADRLKQDPMVDYAEPDIVSYEMSDGSNTPDDRGYPDQWNLSAVNVGINAPAAWLIQKADPSVVTAVIDTGYLTHIDLDANRVSSGLTMLASLGTVNTDATDISNGDVRSHGTAVAGTLSAVTDNGLGVAGVGWNAKFVPVNVFAAHHGAYSADVADAIRWAAGISIPDAPVNNQPAKIINLSLGTQADCDMVYQSAINDAVAKGVTVVVAAGNENMPASWSRPANCNNVITVAGSNHAGQRYSHGPQSGSNYGRAVSVSAPGVDILTTVRGTDSAALQRIEPRTGTSFAAPQVAGVIALMLSANPDLTPAQIKQVLQDTAKKPKLGINEQLCTQPEGAGIVDAGAAVVAVRSMRKG